MKPIQEILDEVTSRADSAVIDLLGRFCDELSANGWVFVHKSHIAGKPPKEEVLAFPDRHRMDS